MARPVVALIGFSADAATELDDYLQRRGYVVRLAADGWQGDALIGEGGVDVAVVELALEDGAGLDLLRRHAAGGTLFMMVNGRSDLIDKILALELGAADAVERPVNPREIAARIGGLIARRGRRGSELLVLENATVDLKAALVMHRSGGEDALSPGQIALLRLFAANPRTVLTRDDIIAAAPAEATDAFDRSIDSRIVRLRRKLDTETITTVRGTGYRFDPPSGG
ncbi:response regulator transcription factor [Mesorhizobium sp. L-8-3]|uniref:response regulator transcription factor n=1 Tax=Mesorhizobium sp. L-8-3 TaxID=2744522 RepID=UPI001926FA00|nr:response regulator transcription factor [Mesorhizobium sp. L-8-3]